MSYKDHLNTLRSIQEDPSDKKSEIIWNDQGQFSKTCVLKIMMGRIAAKERTILYIMTMLYRNRFYFPAFL